jgi:fibronectin-binding autotransporter adhesin
MSGGRKKLSAQFNKPAGRANLLGSVAIAALILGSLPRPADAASATVPQGGTVIAGQATFAYGNNSLTVNQTSTRTVIDWSSFNVGAKSTATFIQPTASSIAVNEVTGTDPATILGTLKSNGQVFILDPNGVLFGKTAKVDVGGLVASTGQIDHSAFMSGGSTLDITGMTTGTVENDGLISVKAGGLAAFVAPRVVNAGTIQANVSTVALGSGSAVTLDLYGDQLVTLKVNGAVANALVQNSGKIIADGGKVQLTAMAAQGVVNSVVNMSGIIQARTVKQQGGRIVLEGGTTGSVSVSGKIDASGTTRGTAGGYVEVTGDNVSLNGASIDASGMAGGGDVYIGGGLHGDIGDISPASVTYVSSDSSINVSDTNSGDGGTAVIWGSQSTGFYGTVDAEGGRNGGNGGFVEVSTGKGVVFAGIVNTEAAKGTMGELLIDPASVTISNAAASPDGSVLNAANMANTLDFTNVAVSATNNIDIGDNINLSVGSFGPTAGSLSLTAPTINFTHNVVFGSGNISFNAPVVNVSGEATAASGALLGAGRVNGTGTTINVLGNTASLQQAMDLSSSSSPVTVNVASGIYQGNLTVSKDVTLVGNVGSGAAGAGATAPTL